jgi:hypothetical protein
MIHREINTLLKIILDFVAYVCHNIIMEEEIFKSIKIEDYIIKPKRGSCRAITFKDLVFALLHTNSGPECAEYLDISPQTFNRTIKKAFPSVSLSGGGQTWKWYILYISDYKKCGQCNKIKLKESFGIDNSKSDGYFNICSHCRVKVNKTYYDTNKDVYHKGYYKENKGAYLDRAALRKAAILQRTPKWADLVKIKEIYNSCPEGYHVDHEIPLQGKLVSGLHVENNLQYLLAKDNLQKHNKFTVL